MFWLATQSFSLGIARFDPAQEKKNEWSRLTCFMVGVPRVTFTMFVRSVIFGNYM